MTKKMGMNLVRMGGAWYVQDEAISSRSVLSTGYRTK